MRGDLFGRQVTVKHRLGIDGSGSCDSWEGLCDFVRLTPLLSYSGNPGENGVSHREGQVRAVAAPPASVSESVTPVRYVVYPWVATVNQG